MRLHALVIVAAGCLVAANAPGPVEKADREKLQGTWSVVALEANGDKVPEDVVKEMEASIKDDHYTLKQGESVMGEGSLKLDTSKTPATIDATGDSGDGAGQTILGIYQFEDSGKTLRVCLTPPGVDRPTEFKSTADNMAILYTFKKN